MKRIISIDLDGVLNTYNGQYNAANIPMIKQGDIEFIQKLSENYKIEIFTARNKKLVKKWLKSNLIEKYIYQISNKKNPFSAYSLTTEQSHLTKILNQSMKK